MIIKRPLPLINIVILNHKSQLYRCIHKQKIVIRYIIIIWTWKLFFLHGNIIVINVGDENKIHRNRIFERKKRKYYLCIKNIFK